MVGDGERGREKRDVIQRCHKAKESRHDLWCRYKRHNSQQHLNSIRQHNKEGGVDEYKKKH